MFREYLPHKILVDIHTEYSGDQQRDTWATLLWVAGLRFCNHADQIFRRALGSGFTLTVRGEKEPIFAFDQSPVEPHQG